MPCSFLIFIPKLSIGALHEAQKGKVLGVEDFPGKFDAESVKFCCCHVFPVLVHFTKVEKIFIAKGVSGFLLILSIIYKITLGGIVAYAYIWPLKNTLTYERMKNTISYFKPVLASTQSTFNAETFRESIDCFHEGNYLQAFHTFLDSLNPKFRKEYGNEAGNEFHIPHGSILVDIYLDDDALKVHTDFMRLPEKGRVAMLRQVASLNINQLLLPYFRLNNDVLCIEYACHLSQTHPSKMYEVFRGVCNIGDKYDDEFATQFGASRIYSPRVMPYAPEEVERIHETIHTIGTQALAAVKEYNGERKQVYAWNVLDTAFYQMVYVAAPQGQLLNDLDKAIDDMDKDLPLNELLTKGCEAMQKIVDMPKEKLAENLYYVDTLVSSKIRSSLRNIQENFKDAYDSITKALQSENYEAGCVRMLYKLYEMYYYNNLQEDVNKITAKALEAASGKPWEEAAGILYEVMDNIMEGELEDDDIDEDYLAALQQNPALAGVSAEDLQKGMEAVNNIQNVILEIQQKMVEAMQRGDMAEYSRLMMEIQQKAMEQALGVQKQ